MVVIIQNLAENDIYSGANNTQLILITLLVVLLLLFLGLLLLYSDLKKRHKRLKKRVKELEVIEGEYFKPAKRTSEKKEFDTSPISNNTSNIDAKNSFEEETGPTEFLFEKIKRDTITDSNQEDEIIQNGVPVNKNSFYLSFPDRESTFYAPEATSLPNEDAFYKVEDDSLMLYDKVSDKQMKAAMNFVENHIKRVCNITNAREPNHTRVIMLNPGKIMLQNDDYIVTKKITVIYD